MKARKRKRPATRPTSRTEAPEKTVPAERLRESDTPASAGRTYCVMAMPPAEGSPRSLSSGEAAVVMPVSARRPLELAPPLPGRARLAGYLRVMGGLLLAAAMVTSPLWLTGERLLPLMKRLSAASAAIELPEGELSGPASQSDIQVPPSTTVTTTTTTAATTTTTAPTTAQSTEGLLPVKEQHIGNSGVQAGDIYVKNSTGYEPDFSALMKKKPDCRIKLNAGYQVLIVHTHTTEGYAQRTDGLYDPGYSPRTTDLSRSVVAVGDALAQELEAVGIRTLHVTEVHDHPKYNGSYDRALATIKKYLEEYPSIEMVLDVHRDAITYDDGSKLKPTAVIDGQKAAQVMIISGCDAGGSLYFPGWEKNLTMALRIQERAQSLTPGLMRPLSFAPFRYNMHMTPNSLLLEFGTDANTLEEAVFSAGLMGKAIAEVLLECEV